MARYLQRQTRMMQYVLFFAVALPAAAAAAPEDAPLVGAWYFNGWHTDSRVYVNGAAPGPEPGVYAGHRDAICNASQSWYDDHPVTLGQTVEIVESLAEHYFLFGLDDVPADPAARAAYCDQVEAAEPSYNYWPRLDRANRMKRELGPALGWPADVVQMEPLGVADGYLGHYDENLVPVVEKQIETAATWGVDFFVYEYHFNCPSCTADTDLLSNSLAPIDAFWGAANHASIRLALLWLNAPWDPTGGDQDYSDAALDKYVDLWVERFFSGASYLKLDGKPVVYLYQTYPLMHDQLGGAAGVRAALDRMRARARDVHGLAGITFVGCGRPTGPVFEEMGFDAYTNYNDNLWWADADYAASTANAANRWTEYRAALSTIPYQPVTHGGIYDSVMGHGSSLFESLEAASDPGFPGATQPSSLGEDIPGQFGQHLADARDFVSAGVRGGRVVMINAWNEWGEGRAIQPSVAFKYGQLAAVREQLGVNLLRNWGLEETTLAPWGTWAMDPDQLTRTSCDLADRCTGHLLGRIESSDQPHQLAYQDIWRPDFAPGQPYVAWAKLRTFEVGGHGARVRVAFRDASDNTLRFDDSVPSTGSSGDFELHVIAGHTIPADATRIIFQILVSASVGAGSGAVVEFDDAAFKARLGPLDGRCSIDWECGSERCLDSGVCCDPADGPCGRCPDTGGDHPCDDADPCTTDICLRDGTCTFETVPDCGVEDDGSPAPDGMPAPDGGRTGDRLPGGDPPPGGDALPSGDALPGGDPLPAGDPSDGGDDDPSPGDPGGSEPLPADPTSTSDAYSIPDDGDPYPDRAYSTDGIVATAGCRASPTPGGGATMLLAALLLLGRRRPR